MTKAEKLAKALREKQGACLTVAAITGHVSNHANVPLDIFVVEVYKNKMTDLLHAAERFYFNILDCCDAADSPTHEQERTELLDKLMKGIADLNRVENLIRPTAQAQANPTGGSAALSSSVKLPKLDLQKFNGDLFRWRTFKDLFTAAVDSSTTISPAQKLQHLKSLLEGQALDAILGITVTDANYPIAWDILCSRYNNKRRLQNAYLDTLFNQPHVKQESSLELQKLWDTTQECERNLQALGYPTDQWHGIFIYVITRRLDPKSRELWEQQTASKPTIALDEIQKFIIERSQALEAINPSPHHSKKFIQPSKQVSPQSKPKQIASHIGTATNCVVCKQDHQLWKCPSFASATTAQRSNIIKQHNLCFNCLRKGHSVAKCQSRNCSKCGKKHNTLLHEDSPGSSGPTPTKEEKTPETESASSPQQQAVVTHCGSNQPQPTSVLLATATILIKDNNGDYKICRALLDSGSQASFISEACAQRLRLKRTRTELGVTGVSDRPCSYSKACVTLNLSSSRDSTFAAVTVAYILSRVTTLIPTSPVNPTSWSHLHGLALADSNFNHPHDVDVLLGADIYYDCLREGFIRRENGAPAAQETVFGWILAGPTTSDGSPKVVCHHTQIMLDDLVRRFWELEEVPSAFPFSSEEEKCELHFQETHTRDSTGRYIVRLPFKLDALPLGNSYQQARRRFFGLERRLSANPELQQQYKAFIHEYLSLGHMKEVSQSEPVPLDSDSYYLPHQAVVRADSSTTKLRVVFDASAKTTHGNSLNDNLLVGAQVQPDLFSILLRFRQFPIALKSDVEKMFRQVLVRSADQPFQRILWRDNPEEHLRTYQLTTVTYGTASAPFLSTRSIVQLSHDEEANFPIASRVLRENCYVDDIMTSVRDEQEAIQLHHDLMSMMQRGGFPLRKWCGNNSNVLSHIPVDYREPKLSLPIEGESPTVKTLGWLAPVTVQAKIILHNIWKLNLTWDDEIPIDNNKDSPRKQWELFQSDLPALEQLQIPRCVTSPLASAYDLVGFSDASEKAYSAVIYVRSISASGHVNIGLLTAKTRVAPSKVLTLPKLELCGAELLANLISVVRRELTLPVSHFHLFSDSTIVLAWLATEPCKLKTFVANRVSRVTQIASVEHWGHVSGTDNPADPASRGISPSDFINNNLWWSGPAWLRHLHLPASRQLDETDLDLAKSEYKKAAIIALPTIVQPWFQRFSTLPKLIRVMAYVLRFIHHHFVAYGPKLQGKVTASEYRAAFHKLIFIAQRESFTEEVQSIEDKDPLPRRSNLAGLKPMLDTDGLIRVGGRISKSDLPYQFKHPLVLPKDHPLTTTLLRQCHLDNLHAGPTLMLSILRQQGLWIIHAKQQCRSTCRRCIRCKRHQADTMNQIMADLPADRLKNSYPFSITGVDYAGPFDLKQIHGKARRIWKVYVAVFVCFSTKAVHLEPVRDLTTAAFIATLRRFVALRGRPSCIYSDNATNFQGASRELQQLKSLEEDDQFADELIKQGIT